jgi:DNA repair exonuclease SbcCD ATPase subunit
MSESVKIVIDADDLASAKVAAAAKNVENNIKAIKSSGENAKKSTEFFGTIAGALGGSELASYASQLAGVTEKTSQFAEVQKLGGAGALAFKAGLVAAVGVISFQVGQALGNVIFQTEDWTKKLAEATARAKELSAEAAKVQMTQFSERRETIEIFDDPKAKQAGYQQLLEETKRNLEGVERQAASSKKALGAYSSTAAYNPFSDISNAQQQAEQDSERLKALKEQKLELEKLLGPQQEENRLLRERLALDKQAEANVTKLKEEIDLLNGKVKVLSSEEQMLIRKRDLLKEEKQKETASDAFIKQLREEVALLKVKKEDLAEAEAASKTSSPAKANIATQLLQERDALIQKRELEKQAAAEKENESKRIADLKKAELDKLEQERVLLTQGKEAAQALALQKQGLSKSDAANIAAQQARIDSLKADEQLAKSLKAPNTQINQAVEARLLTRGSGGDPQADIAKNTAAMLAEQKLANKLAEKNQQSTRIKVLKAGA